MTGFGPIFWLIDTKMKMKMKLFENEYDFWTQQLEIGLYNNFPNHGKNKDEDEKSKNEYNFWTLHPKIRFWKKKCFKEEKRSLGKG